MPVRIALLGADEKTRAFAEILSTLDDVRILAICADSARDIEYSFAENLARRYKTKAFRDLKSLLRVENPDAFCVVSSANAKVRRDAENFVLQNGGELFLIPPLATSVSRAQTLLQNAAQSRARIWVSHSERFLQSSENARKILSAKNHAPISAFGSWRIEIPTNAKNAEKSAVLLESSTRLCGLLRFLCGEIKNVSARTSISLSQNSVSTNAISARSASLKSTSTNENSENAASRNLNSARTISRDANLVSTHSAISMSLNFEFTSGLLGAFAISSAGENRLHFAANSQNLEWNETSISLFRPNETQRFEYSNDAQKAELRAWISAVQSGKRALAKSNSSDALQTLRVALAAQQAAKTNKSVRIS